MLKSIKIRIYPNTTQQSYLNDLFGSYRFVFNNCLSLKKESYLKDKSNLGLKELGNYFHQTLTKNSDYIWLTNHNTKVLKQSVINLLDSYKRFFINGSGFPNFKSKHDNIQSCRFPLEAISKKNNYLSNKLTLTSQLKDIKFRTSDKYVNYLNKYKEGIKSATLSKTKSNKYFLSILVDSNELLELDTPKNNIVGIDLGIKTFIVDSNGVEYDNLKIIRNNKNKLAKLHKNLSKKENGSKNKEKARIKLAKFNEKLTNKKENYLHEVANKLLNDNQVIVIENLNVSGMMKNHKLAKSIQELSLNRFKNILKYKSEWYGRDLVDIDRWFASSKLCSCCGNKKIDLELKHRLYNCSECNLSINRDLNAAINIKNEGIRLLGLK
jgi:putative transposase